MHFVFMLWCRSFACEKKRRAPATNVPLKRADTAKSQSSKGKIFEGEKKGMRQSSDSWCDYVVVSDSLEGLAPAVKINRRGNLDAFIAKPVLEKPSSPAHAEPSSMVNEDIPPSTPRAPISEQLGSTKAAGNDEAEKTAGAENPEPGVCGC
ncbi:hypothetical protein Hanom_Chr07g00656861 [Helianthus anomalus]